MKYSAHLHHNTVFIKRTYFRLTICLLWTYRIKIIYFNYQFVVTNYDDKYLYINIEYFRFYSLFFYFILLIFTKHYGLFIYILKLYNPYHIILISGWNKRIKSGREGAPFLKVEFLKFYFFKKSFFSNEEIFLI